MTDKLIAWRRSRELFSGSVLLAYICLMPPVVIVSDLYDVRYVGQLRRELRDQRARLMAMSGMEFATSLGASRGESERRRQRAAIRAELSLRSGFCLPR